jgi:F-type H+-transporting ATPase subunit c
MLYLFGLVIACGFALAVAAVAGGLGQARAIAAAMEGIARQPEAGGRLFMSLIVGLAFIESLTIYTLVVAFRLFGKLPATSDIITVLRGAGVGH